APSFFTTIALLITFSRLPLQDVLPPIAFVAAAVAATALRFHQALGWPACRRGLVGLFLFAALIALWLFSTRALYPVGHDDYGYHLAAIWDLAAEWHPFFSNHNNIWVG